MKSDVSKDQFYSEIAPFTLEPISTSFASTKAHLVLGSSSTTEFTSSTALPERISEMKIDQEASFDISKSKTVADEFLPNSDQQTSFKSA